MLFMGSIASWNLTPLFRKPSFFSGKPLFTERHSAPIAEPILSHQVEVGNSRKLTHFLDFPDFPIAGSESTGTLPTTHYPLTQSNHWWADAVESLSPALTGG